MVRDIQNLFGPVPDQIWVNGSLGQTKNIGLDFGTASGLAVWPSDTGPDRSLKTRLVHAWSNSKLSNTMIIWIIAGTTSRTLSEEAVNMVKIRGGDRLTKFEGGITTGLTSPEVSRRL